jgi:N-acetylglucosamine-6-phosphate deacetylase
MWAGNTGQGCNNSSMRVVITADRLWDGFRTLNNPVVHVEDKQIVAIESAETSELPRGAEVRNFAGAILGPSFFDVHIHGAAGHDVMEGTDEALNTVGRFLASRGTGAYLATTVTAAVDSTLRSLDAISKFIKNPPARGQAKPIGIHLEGPFISHAKRGVHPPELLLAPSVALFDRMFEAAQGLVRLLTLAPELPDAAELAAHATARGVRVSVGHSNATAAETRAVIEAGATSATHTFNAMRALDHREPGILGTVLTTDALYAEMICDGIHTAPEIVRLWWKCKGPERAILVTDAMSAAGMPDGTYRLGEFAVEVADGRATVNGVLAGSVLTLDRALSNFLAFTGATVEQGLRLLTSNPAAVTGYGDNTGGLRVGSPANLVAVSPSGKLIATFVGGQFVE